MTSFDWQFAIAAVLSALAGGYLLHRVWLAFRGRATGCHSCSSCPASKPTLVSIETRSRAEAK